MCCPKTKCTPINNSSLLCICSWEQQIRMREFWNESDDLNDCYPGERIVPIIDDMNQLLDVEIYTTEKVVAPYHILIQMRMS